MKFSKLRLTGFKSFVEPTELHIAHGLTGVVGPNGCGKSNLLEALRWVMGESSYKSMRASGMEDVIFSGTTQRPARNLAEVMLTLENDDKSAPPAYNENEMLEVSRTIERDAAQHTGSIRKKCGLAMYSCSLQMFRVALVLLPWCNRGRLAKSSVRNHRQGDLILEEAAGITGLHTRRHDAELKLKAAEQNLARVDDVMAQLDSQLNSLKRQARQARKYKDVSSEIRKLEAAGLFVAWRDASDAATRDTQALNEATRVLAEAYAVGIRKIAASR